MCKTQLILKNHVPCRAVPFSVRRGYSRSLTVLRYCTYSIQCIQYVHLRVRYSVGPFTVYNYCSVLILYWYQKKVCTVIVRTVLYSNLNQYVQYSNFNRHWFGFVLYRYSTSIINAVPRCPIGTVHVQYSVLYIGTGTVRQSLMLYCVRTLQSITCTYVRILYIIP